MLNHCLISPIPPNTKYGFDDRMCDMLARKEDVNVVPYGGYWLDIGRPDDYHQAIEDFENGRRDELLQ
jgi:NDP-sugar pyrophosphorylase family protein